MLWLNDCNWLGIKEYRGMNVQYSRAQDSEKPVAVFAKGMGIPGEHYAWMHLLNQAGVSSVFSSWRGQFENYDAGKFIGEGNSAPDKTVSVIHDLDDLVSFAVDELDAKKVCLIGACFGGAPALSIAAERRKIIERIFLYAPMIFTDDCEKNKRYMLAGDLAQKLGEEYSCGGRFFGRPNGFSPAKWERIINGVSCLNPYLKIGALAQMPLMIMHPKNDKMVSCYRSEDFYNKVLEHTETLGAEQRIRLKVLNEGGHKNGFEHDEQKEVLKFLFPSLSEEEIIKAFAATEKNKAEFRKIIVSQINFYREKGCLRKEPSVNKIIEQILGSL